MEVVLAHPKGYELPKWVLDKAKENAEASGGSFRVTHDQEDAYKDADIVIPKNWGSWVSNQSEDVLDDILEANKHWKCTEDRLAHAKGDVSYMHALPADRGNEVEDSVIDGPHSVVYQEAENRIHTAKAVMAMTMGDK
jgi:ornithine carbamoyltransferase